MITRLYVGDALSHRLDDSSAFMAKYNGKVSFGVFAGEGVCICCASQL